MFLLQTQAELRNRSLEDEAFADRKRPLDVGGSESVVLTAHSRNKHIYSFNNNCFNWDVATQQTSGIGLTHLNSLCLMCQISRLPVAHFSSASFYYVILIC